MQERSRNIRSTYFTFCNLCTHPPDIHVFLFSKAFRTDKCGKLIQSISQRAKRTGITAKMTSEQNGNDQQQCRDIQKGVPGYALLSSDCKKDRFYSCKCSRKKRWRCYKKYKLYGGTDQPYLSLFSFSCVFRL